MKNQFWYLIACCGYVGRKKKNGDGLMKEGIRSSPLSPHKRMSLPLVWAVFTVASQEVIPL